MEAMDIYDVNEDLVKALCKDKKIEKYSEEFNKIPENHKKINYIEQLLISYQQIPKLELKFELRVSKNNEKSLKFRQEGNKFFGLNNKDYFKALELYNKSICFAEEDSENLSIGYANRSAILFEWKRYRECLENIRLARNANYPDRLGHKLNEREKKCLELLSTQPDDLEPHDFQLVSDKHPQIPLIADCLDIRYTKDLGRYVYTKKDLHPGDLVATDDPFCTILLPAMRYVRCANCTRENFLTLIPCPECTSAMFCSKKCLDEGTEIFHRFECPVIDFLYALFNKIHLIALRVTLTAFSIFETVDELRAFCKADCNQDQSAFDIDYGNLTRKEHYRAIHGLVTNQAKRSTSDLFQRGVISAVLRWSIVNRSPLKDFLFDESGIILFSEILFRHLQTAPTNMHGISLIEQKNESKDDESFGSGAYAFASLLNHSCSPNTVRIYRGTKLHLFVTRPIPANGLLFDNYGYHYATQPRANRKTNLKTQYHFSCMCEACEKDYPLYHDLPAHPKVPEIVEGRDVYSLLAFDRQFAAENYGRYAAFLENFKSYYPCAQVSSTEESLKMALNILMDSVPLKAKANKF